MTEPDAPTGSQPAETPDARSRLGGVAASLAGGAGDVFRRIIGEAPGARIRRVRRMGHQPLANLWQAQPEARLASMRELGLRVEPIEQVCGTAVEGPTQRGGDFLPLRQLRGRDWSARWQRIRRGIDELATLPPIDLLKVGDCYWVVDGHNRVGAALYTGQEAIDANVVELVLPGQRSTETVANVAGFLEGSRDVREAGSGRFTRTSIRPTQVLAEHPLDEHADEVAPADADDGAASDQPRDDGEA